MYTIIPYTIKSISINNRKKRKIPYVIIQTMKCNKVPINMYKATQTWVKKNPDYDYEFFDDSRCIEFIEEYYDKNILTKFKIINTGAGKADFFRWLYLFKKGGVYVDIDSVCKIGLTQFNMINPNDNFISKYSTTHSTRINHHILMVSPNNHLLEKAINKSISNINYLYLMKKNEKITQDLCGPGVLYNEFLKLINTIIENPLIKTSSTRNPQKILIDDERYIFLARKTVLHFCIPKYHNYHNDQSLLKNIHYTQTLAFDYEKCLEFLKSRQIDINGKEIKGQNLNF